MYKISNVAFTYVNDYILSSHINQLEKGKTIKKRAFDMTKITPKALYIFHKYVENQYFFIFVMITVAAIQNSW